MLRQTDGEKPSVLTWIAIAFLGSGVSFAFASTCTAVERGAGTYALSRRLPVALLLPGASLSPRAAGWIVACAVAETAALWAIARLLAGLRLPAPAMAAAVGLALVAMSAIALGARGSTSFDAYTYMQYAKARSFATAYAPTANEPLPDAFRSVGVFAGPHPVPCVYGPLWLAFDRALLAGTGTQADAFTRLRAAGTFELACFLALLWAAGIETRVVLALALCPPLYQFFIVEAHNDLLALALLAAASALLRTPVRAIAAIVAGSAALVKLNFALLALAALARPQRTRLRIAEAAAVVAIAIVGSELLAGPAYFAALRSVASHRPPDMSTAKFLAVEGIKGVCALIAVVAILAAFARDRWWRGAAWTMPALASATWPWYASWALPYALRSPASGSTFVASMPLVALALDRTITLGLKAGLVSLYFIAAAVVALIDRGPDAAKAAPLDRVS